MDNVYIHRKKEQIPVFSHFLLYGLYLHQSSLHNLQKKKKKDVEKSYFIQLCVLTYLMIYKQVFVQSRIRPIHRYSFFSLLLISHSGHSHSHNVYVN